MEDTEIVFWKDPTEEVVFEQVFKIAWRFY